MKCWRKELQLRTFSYRTPDDSKPRKMTSGFVSSTTYFTLPFAGLKSYFFPMPMRYVSPWVKIWNIHVFKKEIIFWLCPPSIPMSSSRCYDKVDLSVCKVWGLTDFLPANMNLPVLKKLLKPGFCWFSSVLDTNTVQGMLTNSPTKYIVPSGVFSYASVNVSNS